MVINTMDHSKRMIQNLSNFRKILIDCFHTTREGKYQGFPNGSWDGPLEQPTRRKHSKNSI